MEITQTNAGELLQREKASYDIQIATAKMYPRDLRRAVDNAIATVTMTKEAAESCGYALPRGGKPITGPSVHLARILAQTWGNLRVESRVTDITHNQVVSQSVAFDLETNVAVKVEVRRSISGRNGRFSEDMITVTGNAANAISFRNAIYNVVPKAVVDKVYQASRDFITGDLSDETKLIKSRDNAIRYFKENYKATEAEICGAVGVASINAIKQNEIVLMGGIKQALVDGDSTPEEVFERNTPKDKKAEKLAEGIKDKVKEGIKPNTALFPEGEDKKEEDTK